MRCKKLVLHVDEPPANLHATKRWLDLSRQTRMITDDNGDTVFVNEVQLKPRSLGHDYGYSSQTATPTALGSRHRAAFPLRACRYVVMVTTAAPSHIYEARVTEYDTDSILYCQIQLKSHRNRTVQIFDTISNKLHLGQYSTTLKPSWTNLIVYQTWAITLPLYQEMPEETLLSLQFLTPWLYLQLCTLLFYHHNLCKAQSDSTPAKQILNLTSCFSNCTHDIENLIVATRVTYRNRHISIVLPLPLPYYDGRLTP
jgi:hypothetical protein